MTYKARALDGKVVEGRLRARDEHEVRMRLSEKGMETLSIASLSDAAPSASDSPDPQASAAHRPLPPSGSRASAGEIRSMTAQLALMLETGTPLAECLLSLQEQTEGTAFGDMLGEIHRSVSAGNALSRALSDHPRVFDEFYISAVKAGETSGKLADVFARIDLHMSKREELLSRIRTALIYPIILSCLATGAVIFLVSFVLPKFATVFGNSGVQLPAPTRLLLWMTHAFQLYWYWLFLGAGTCVGGGVWFFRNPAGRPIKDRVALGLPLLRSLVTATQTAALLRVLGTLLSSGVPLVDSLSVARDACSNIFFKKAVEEVSKGILRGEGLASNVSKSPLFSPSVKRMIETGERTGRLAFVTSRMADYLEEIAQRQIQRISALFEPAVIVVMGIIIGFIAVSLMLPLFRLSSAMAAR
ncbi:type II secretion system F family protein [Candidatus Sumerlaeota bacterium]|nr:type II secretion system F family protein [Candidatus Sumerlaeota bacterium]